MDASDDNDNDLPDERMNVWWHRIGCCRRLLKNERKMSSGKTLKQFSFSNPLSTHKPSLIHFSANLIHENNINPIYYPCFKFYVRELRLVCRNVPTRLRRLKAHKHNACGIKNVCKTQHIINDYVVYRKLFLFSFLKSLAKRWARSPMS